MKPTTMKGLLMPKYGFWNFVLDATLFALTGGIWLIWIFVREMRGRS